MGADETAGSPGPDTWNGVPVPPRPPLPVLPGTEPRESAESIAPVTVPPGIDNDTRRPDGEKPPRFIGLPPGMQADIDTVPTTTGSTPRTEAAEVSADDSVSDLDLEFPDGSRVSAEGSILIGRDPTAQSAFPDAQLVSIVDVTRSVSKTHAAVQWSRGAVWVTDLNSTNGTRILDATGRETACVPEAPTPAPRDGGILFGRCHVPLRARGSDGSA